MQKRLAKAERRAQLLETALDIVRDEGADALTLGHLAELAGVSKPIAYEHFETRQKLLVALCEWMDERQLVILKATLAEAPQKLEDVAKVASDAYMHCYMTVGPEWHAIVGALQGDEIMIAYQRAIMSQYVDIFRDAVARFSPLSRTELRRRCLGIIGAAEALSKDMLSGEISEAAAAKTLAAMFIAAVR